VVVPSFVVRSVLTTVRIPIMNSTQMLVGMSAAWLGTLDTVLMCFMVLDLLLCANYRGRFVGRLNQRNVMIQTEFTIRHGICQLNHIFQHSRKKPPVFPGGGLARMLTIHYTSAGSLLPNILPNKTLGQRHRYRVQLPSFPSRPVTVWTSETKALRILITSRIFNCARLTRGLETVLRCFMACTILSSRDPLCSSTLARLPRRDCASVVYQARGHDANEYLVSPAYCPHSGALTRPETLDPTQ